MQDRINPRDGAGGFSRVRGSNCFVIDCLGSILGGVDEWLGRKPAFGQQEGGGFVAVFDRKTSVHWLE